MNFGRSCNFRFGNTFWSRRTKFPNKYNYPNPSLTGIIAAETSVRLRQFKRQVVIKIPYNCLDKYV